MSEWLPQLVAGWVLGVAGTLVVQKFQSSREEAELKDSLAFELQELRHRLMVVVYYVADKTGERDRALLEWMLPVVKNYRGVNPSAGIVSGMEGLLRRTDAELAALNANTKNAPHISTSLPTVEAPFLEQAASRLRDNQLRARCLDVLLQLRQVNDHIAEVQFFVRLSFTPGLTDENHARAGRNEAGHFAEAGRRARIAVEKVLTLEERHGLAAP